MSVSVPVPTTDAPDDRNRNVDQRQHRLNCAVDAITQARLLQPEVAIILGSGLGGLAEDIQHPTAVPYNQIPYFETTHAVGHKGQLILGYLSGMPAVVMQGRYHRYEGHSAESVRFPVSVMHALGAKTLIVTNAAGGLNPRFRAGDLMVIDQHMDCLWPRNHALTCDDPASAALPSSNDAATSASLVAGTLRQHAHVYDPDLSDRVRRIALRNEIMMHKGTYVATLGPTYETRAEYRMFRWMGGDAVGMSTVPEVLTARACGMRVLAVSVITNVACTDQPHGTSHDEVVECGRQVEPKMRRIVGQLLEDMSGPAD